MKILPFFAKDFPSAIQTINEQYGENAFILSSHRLKENELKLIIAINDSETTNKIKAKLKNENIEEKIKYFYNVLQHHDFNPSFIYRLAQATIRKNVKTNDDKLLFHALNEIYSFKPIYPVPNNPIYVFVGNAGSGKTLTLKKMALQAKKENLSPAIVSLDTIKSGAGFDLKNFANLLKIPFVITDDIKNLNETLTIMRLKSNYILVDTPAINPYNNMDINKLNTIHKELSDAEFILTMPGGLSTKEAIAQGALFKKNGCTQLIATKLDCSLKYYNLLQTTLHNSFFWAGFCFSNKITNPPLEANAQNLTLLLTTTHSSK